MENKTDSINANQSGAADKKSSKAANTGTESEKAGLWSKSWVYILIMGLLTFVIFGQFFFSNQMLFSSDQVGGFDSKVFLKDALVNHHEFPFWFNSRLGGMPSNDASFGDSFYPVSVITTCLFSIARSISMKMILHVFLAGVFFFLMLRKGFKMPPLVSLAGAVFYMLNPEFFSHIYPGHDGKMYVIALLPFVIWRLKALMDIPNLLNVTLLAAGVGLSLLTSHIQMVYFVLWGMFFYWIIATVLFLRSKENKKAAIVAVCFWSSIFIGIGIALIQFLPSYVYVQNAYSVRGVDRGFEFASSWSLHWPEFFSMWIPEFVNSLDYYWGQNPFKLNSEYAGAMALLLGTLAVISKPTIWRIFWGSVAVFALLFSLGAHTPIFYLVYYLIPGVKKFRACSMIMFWFSFSTILLASLFLKDIIAGKFAEFTDVRKKKWTKGIYITLGLMAIAAVLFSMEGFVQNLFGGVLAETGKQNVFSVNFTKNFVPFLWLWFFLGTAALVSFMYVINGKLSPSWFVVIVLIIGVVDTLRVDMQFIKLFNPAPYFATEPALQPLQSEMKEEPFRCYSLPGSLPQNGEGIHGLEGVNGFHDNELRWYREYRGEQDRNYISGIVDVSPDGKAYLSVDKLSGGSPLLNIANVKYMLVRNQSDLIAVKNVNALGRVSFVSKYAVVDTSEILAAIMQQTYDYRTTVILEKNPQNVKVDTSALLSEKMAAKWEKYSPNHRKVSVSVPADGFLRIAEAYYPGWEVKIDGNKVPFYKADLAWMAVNITKGNHVVEMIPHSVNFRGIAAISFGIVALMVLYWLFIGISGIIRKR